MFPRAPMSRSKSRFPRGLNWSHREKDELLRLVGLECYKFYIENKDCDSLSHRRRSESWAAIAKHFAYSFPPGRETQKMKEQYQRMKSMARKMLATHVNILQLYQEGDGERQHLGKLPKWVEQIVSIIPRDFHEYYEFIKPSDFSENDNFGGQESSDNFEGDVDDHSQFHINIKTSMDNQESDLALVPVPIKEVKVDDILPEIHFHHEIKIETNGSGDEGQKERPIKSTTTSERLKGLENHLLDENDSASVASIFAMESSIAQPEQSSAPSRSIFDIENCIAQPQQNSTFSRSSRMPHSYSHSAGTPRKRKVPDRPQWVPETCSERIQWEEHLQKVRHLDEEHAVKMDIMNLHKQVLQQHVQHSLEDPRNAHNFLASSAQVFDSLSKICPHSHHFTPLS